VVEAIVEDLGAKRALFAQLEALLGDEAVLATNTSSISVTAIANGLQQPGPAGRHALLQPGAADEAGRGGQRPAHEPAVARPSLRSARPGARCRCMRSSTPGFIVNRIARPYYAETLALLQEQAAAPQVLDACLKAAGFRMGPCELMDLIGHDTNFAVTNSVYEANFSDKRFQPSLVQREMVDGGLLGRKSGRGFYCYPKACRRRRCPAGGAGVAPGRRAAGGRARRRRLAEALAPRASRLPSCTMEPRPGPSATPSAPPSAATAARCRVRTDDLGAIPLKALMARNPGVDWGAVTTCSTAAPTRPARTTATSRTWPALLAGLPVERARRHDQPPVRLGPGRRGHGGARHQGRRGALMIAGGVESMSRAPFVMPKADSAFSRSNAVYDTTIGWRFVNPR
jgi:hypothetical protein